MVKKDRTTVEELGEVAVERHTRQWGGLHALFLTIFTEYYEKYHEWPPIRDDHEVRVFLLARPDAARAVERMEFVQNEVTRIALYVLKQSKKGKTEG